jgi:anti-sigma B factor antagonist
MRPLVHRRVGSAWGPEKPARGEEVMGLQIETRQSGDITILDLHGRVTIGRDNDLLSSQLRELVASGCRKLLLNLASVQQMDSSGLCSLVRSFVTLQRAGGNLGILKPQGHTRDVLALTGLLRAIPTFDDEATALGSFH